MADIKFKYGNVHYTVQGKGRAIILLHGFLESHAVWHDFAKDLSKSYRVICIDLPGHGKTDCFGYIHTMELMAECVKTVLSKLRLTKYILVGHSMGGYVSLAFAEKYSDNVKGLVLFHSTAASDTEEKKADRERAIKACKRNHNLYVREAINKLFAPDNIALFPKEIKKVQDIAVATTNQGIIDCLEGMKVRSNREVILKFAPFPVLFINGGKDAVIPYENIQHQLQLASRTETLLLPDAGHMGFIEARDTSQKAIRKFARKAFMPVVKRVVKKKA